jgi:hypothetical protein
MPLCLQSVKIYQQATNLRISKSIRTKTAADTRVSTRTEANMEKAHTIMSTGTSIQVIGSIIKKQAKAFLLGLTVTDTR